MTYTTSDATYGGSVDYRGNLDAILFLPWPINQNSARMIIIDGSHLLVLPRIDRSKLRPSSRPHYVIHNDGPHIVTVVSEGGQDGFSASTNNVNPGESMSCYLTSTLGPDGTDIYGTWGFTAVSGAVLHAELANRLTFEAVIGDNGFFPINIRDEIENTQGYRGVEPVALTIRVQPNITRGSDDWSVPAVDTGTWPPGSTALLIVGAGAKILGRGGRGGRGSVNYQFAPNTSPFSPDGGDGGPALRVQMDLGIYNYGIIGGGGGGGGGGQMPGNATGQGTGGGGGGAGFGPSLRGEGVVAATTGSTFTNGQPGQPGEANPGYGGVSVNGSGRRGGTYGQPGLDGTTTVAVDPGNPQAHIGNGGAAGAALEVLTGKTANFLVPGTTFGATVAI